MGQELFPHYCNALYMSCEGATVIVIWHITKCAKVIQQHMMYGTVYRVYLVLLEMCKCGTNPRPQGLEV